MESKLQARGVEVTRASVSQKTTEFSSVVSRIGAGVDVVFLPWQVAAGAQVFGQQLRAARKQGDHRRLGRAGLR